MKSTASSSGRDRLAVLLLTLMLTALFHRLPLGVMGSSNILNDLPWADAARTEHRTLLAGLQGDVWRAIQPFHAFHHAEARVGRLAMWNPHILLGHPFLANAQAGVFHPLNLPHFVIDPAESFGWLAALRLWLSTLAMYGFARHLGLTPAAATITAMSWGLSGYNIRWLQWTPISLAALTTPPLVWALDRFLVRPGPRRFAVAALVAGTLQLSGHPESQLLTGLSAGVWCLGRVIASGGAWFLIFGRVGMLALIMALGLPLAGVSLVPFALELRDSLEVRENLHALRSLPGPEALITLLSPDWYGRPRLEHLYRGPNNYLLVSAWIGQAPLLLALFGGLITIQPVRPAPSAADDEAASNQPPMTAMERPLRAVDQIAPWRAIAWGWIGLALLMYGGDVSRRIGALIPVLSLVNILYATACLTFFGSLLAGYGVTRLATLDRRGWTRGFGLLLMAMSPARIALCLVGYRTGLAESDRWGAGLVDFVQHPAIQDLGLTVLAGLAALIGWRLSGVRSTESVGRVRSALLVLALIGGGELLWHAWDQNPIGPRRLLQPDLPERLEPLRGTPGSGRFVGGANVMFPSLAMRLGLRDLRGYDFPVIVRVGRTFAELGFTFGVNQLPNERLFPTLHPPLAALLDRAGVRWLLSEVVTDSIRRPHETADNAWRRVPTGNASEALWFNPAALPRAFVAGRYRTGSALDAKTRLLDPDPAADPRELLILEPADAIEFSDPVSPNVPSSGSVVGSGVTPAGSPGEVVFLRDEPNLVELEVTVPDPADAAPLPPERSSAVSENRVAVVLLDRMAKGWRVFVDDQPADGWTAQYLFRAVLVAPGKHRIRWAYETPGLRLGAGLTAGTLILLVLLLTRGRPSSIRGSG